MRLPASALNLLICHHASSAHRASINQPGRRRDRSRTRRATERRNKKAVGLITAAKVQPASSTAIIRNGGVTPTTLVGVKSRLTPQKNAPPTAPSPHQAGPSACSFRHILTLACVCVSVYVKRQLFSIDFLSAGWSLATPPPCV